MKRKSVFGFVTGILGLIAAGIIGFYVYLVFGIAIGLSEAANGATMQTTILKIIEILYFASIALALISVCFYFNKAKVGGRLMFIAAALNAALPIYGATGDIDVSIVIVFVPLVLFIISALSGSFSKKQ